MERMSFLGRRRGAVLLALRPPRPEGWCCWRARGCKRRKARRAAARHRPRISSARSACAGCHPVEQAAWSSSHHRHAMEPADVNSVLGDFGDVTFRYFGRETRFWRQGSTFQVTTENQQGKAETFKVAYTLGYAPLQQYLVAFDDGRIQALPFAWDARPREQGGQRWFHLYPDTNVTPADPLFWMRPRQNWNHMCGDCHTTSFSKRFSDATGRFDSRWSELGNGCESCHGAGSAHVEAAQHPGRTGGVRAAFRERAAHAGRAARSVRRLPRAPRPPARGRVPRAHARHLAPGAAAGRALLRRRADQGRGVRDWLVLAKQDGGARDHLQPLSRAAHGAVARRRETRCAPSATTESSSMARNTTSTPRARTARAA